VSWFQPSLVKSIAGIQSSGIAPDEPIIDIGGGSSTLVDDLLALGYSDVSVMDISEVALMNTRNRLGAKANAVTWIAADVTNCILPKNHFAAWHDRALFHFLISEEDRARYIALLSASVRPGGIAIIATFGPNAPPQCSGLDVVRYTPETLSLGRKFSLMSSEWEQHTTPSGKTQEFLYSIFLCDS